MRGYNVTPNKMYLEDSDGEDVIVVFKPEGKKVTFNESLNEIYYISKTEYLIQRRKKL